MPADFFCRIMHKVHEFYHHINREGPSLPFKPSRRLIYLVLLLVLLPGALLLHSRPAATAVSVPDEPAKPALRVVLIPLDSRPPCTQFVQQLGKMANIAIITPPAELLDNYHQPADRGALRDWLQQHIAAADAAVISVDMLTHGGLMASRLPLGTATDYQATLDFLTNLHEQHPHVPLYVFSIIPRLRLADTAENRAYQQAMIKYSTLRDEINTFENPHDLQELTKITRQIPAPVIQRYNAMYAANTAANQRLIDMTASGIIHTLVIGQDDAMPFGLANLEKARLDAYLSRQSGLAGRVFITRGTDEVALTILGNIGQSYFATHPSVYVEYSSPVAPYTVMPYMPHTVARTVQEKAALLHLTLVATPDDAAIIMYVHIGAPHTAPQQLAAEAARVQDLLASDKAVAVVDLSQDYQASDTLLPALLAQNVAINRLAAYAGWNTTSNSIGTALTQAFLYTAARQHTTPNDIALLREKARLEFLYARLLDDWYYQKLVEPRINQRLKWTDTDPNALGTARPAVERLIRRELLPYGRELFARAFADTALPPDGTAASRFIITSIDLDVSLPWERTFEIKVAPTLSLSQLQQTQQEKQAE